MAGSWLETRHVAMLRVVVEVLLDAVVILSTVPEAPDVEVLDAAALEEDLVGIFKVVVYLVVLFRLG
jgi:hypothetical protein